MWTKIWELQPPGTCRAHSSLLFPPPHPLFLKAFYKCYPEIEDAKWVRGEGKSLL